MGRGGGGTGEQGEQWRRGEERGEEEREVVGFGLEGGFRKMSCGWFFVKTTRILDFSLLHIEINFTERIYIQNNLASVLFRSDELNCSVISIKRKGFFCKTARACADRHADRPVGYHN